MIFYILIYLLTMFFPISCFAGHGMFPTPMVYQESSGYISGIYGNNGTIDIDTAYVSDGSLHLVPITIDGTGQNPSINMMVYYALNDSGYVIVPVIYDGSGNRIWYGSVFQDTEAADPWISTYTFTTSGLTLPAGTYRVGMLTASPLTQLRVTSDSGGTFYGYNATAVPWNSGVPPSTLPASPTVASSDNPIVWLEF